MRIDWWKQMLKKNGMPLDEGLTNSLHWFWQKVQSAKDEVLRLIDVYKDNAEEAIKKAAQTVGIDKAELLRRAKAVNEGRLDEGWFTNIMDWWASTAGNFFRGLTHIFDNQVSLACAIIALGTLGFITTLQIPFLNKLVVWLYAYYLVDKAGRK